MSTLSNYIKSIDRFVIVDIPNGADKNNLDCVNVLSGYDDLQTAQMFLTDFYEQYTKNEDMTREIYSKVSMIGHAPVFVKFKHDGGEVCIYDIFNKNYLQEVAHGNV